jgi:hypothetical protein
MCLLAVRQLGGRGVPAKQDLFSKGLKTAVKTALEKGWLRADKAAVQTAGKGGKVKSSKVDVLDLTSEGEEVVLRLARPETLAAVTAAQAAGLRERLEADRQQLRADVLAAVSDKGKAKGKADPAKEMAALAKPLATLEKTVGDLAKRLEKIEAMVQSGGTEPILQKIDQAFAGLVAKLGPLPSAGTGSGAVAAPPPPTTPTAQPLGDVLRRAYEDLCQLIEFEDRLVPLPRLYHQARHRLPDLNVQAFHDKVQALWDEGVLELQVANDVRDLREQEKGIRRGDNLYYYILWHQR